MMDEKVPAHNNILIEASAGTGKTQKLAERLISLVGAKIRPEEIVALTFSRAAAGEIFERFVMLLADSSITTPSDAIILRQVIESQHLSQIGTLDSFLMRIVRSFPLELGIIGQLEMLDDYQAAAERARVSFGILRRTDTSLKRDFVKAFALAMNQEKVRSFLDGYRKFISEWHADVLSLPDPEAWGNAARLGILDADNPNWGSASALEEAANELAKISDTKDWLNLVEWVRNCRGKITKVGGIAGKLLGNESLFDGATIDFKFNRREYSYGGEDALTIRKAIRAVINYAIRKSLDKASGIYKLVTSFEVEYAKKVRNAGHLIFADIPRLICNLSEEARLAIEYRMDSKINAWALDEFQDTSREQWKALTRLLDEAKQSGGEKSVFIVGDSKQAIYGWRNGDVEIFKGERDSGMYKTEPLNSSWRYCPIIADAINKIFVYGRICDEYPTWSAPEHTSNKTDLTGFVQRVEATGDKKENFVEPIYNALKAVNPVQRGIAAAILVRTNDFGEMLAEELKRKGLDGVVWEGENAILDTPALSPFLDTLAIADHPGDVQSYEHFCRSHLAKARYGSEIPPATKMSEEFAKSFAVKGIVRTFNELREYLPKDPAEAWSWFIEDRFIDMLRAAAEFEVMMRPGVRLADFADYLASRKKRNVAEPGKIKIMTIHRSKGLGFDYVVLPLYERNGLETGTTHPLKAEGWILPDFSETLTPFVPTLKKANEERKERAIQEALCTYYVAMTRAKRAITVVLHPKSNTETGTQRFSNFVRESLPDQMGTPDWYQEFSIKTDSDKVTQSESDANKESIKTIMRLPRKHIKRKLPSLSFQTGTRAGDLFLQANARKEALERGSLAHAEYEKIEWIKPELAKTDFERELVRPKGEVVLWREHPFEILLNDTWTSGRFDRVVFADGKATIYDYKTNAKASDETDEAFAARMKAAYSVQMNTYRSALSILTGLNNSEIELKLLLSSTNSVVMI